MSKGAGNTRQSGNQVSNAQPVFKTTQSEINNSLSQMGFSRQMTGDYKYDEKYSAGKDAFFAKDAFDFKQKDGTVKQVSVNGKISTILTVKAKEDGSVSVEGSKIWSDTYIKDSKYIVSSKGKGLLIYGKQSLNKDFINVKEAEIGIKKFMDKKFKVWK